MIVRISGEGQFELADGIAQRLNDLDNEAVAAVEAGEEQRFLDLFGQIVALIRAQGSRLADDDLRGSDVIVPPPDTSFDEARHDFNGEGLIPG
jgi:PspA-Associated protein